MFEWIRLPAPGRRWRRARATVAMVAAWAFAMLFPALGQAATATHQQAFNFNHTGSVSTGLVSIGGTFTNSGITTPTALTLPRFDPLLGNLTGVAVKVTTTGTQFSVSTAGLLSLVSSASVTRTLAYGITAGTATGSGSNAVTTSGAGLLTLLGLGAVEVGGAPLAATTNFTTAADLVQFTGSGTVSVGLTSTDALTVVVGVSVLNGAGLNGTGNYTGTVEVSYTYVPAVTVRGAVYRDADRDGFKGAGEAGTGLPLYAKIVPTATPAGPAWVAATVDPTTGLYSLTIPRGSYRILIDDNATLSDVTPAAIPAGWTGLQQADLLRVGVTVAADVTGQDFGLVRGTAVSGRVFRDDGTGASTANDGIANGGEVGLAGSTVQLLDAVNTVLDTAVSRADGTYRLYVPSTVSAGAVLRVRQTNLDSHLSTGASVGNTVGVYVRSTDTTTWTYAVNAVYAGLDFGDVPVPLLTGGGSQAAAPGGVLSYGHAYTATSAGQLALSVSRESLPAIGGWTEGIFLDQDQNGVADASDPPVTGPLAVVAGQKLFFVVKVAVPAGAPYDARSTITVRADMSHSLAAPALTVSLMASDVTVVLPRGSDAVVLHKLVDKGSALPGSTLSYTLNFTNTGPAPVAGIAIQDATPPYTTFVSATLVTTPAGLGTPVTVVPAAGAAGAVRWTFPGQLGPSASGSVRFVVKIDP